MIKSIAAWLYLIAVLPLVLVLQPVRLLPKTSTLRTLVRTKLVPVIMGGALKIHNY